MHSVAFCHIIGYEECDMKIAIICDVLGKANNGTVIATINLINYLRDKGHTVYVV